ncbi:hypothetical protein [Brevundimonas sp.]|uniref:TetR/AcrR family transcriptional regulator n=1 Tax=Brevundimonas sp. TaxID=1871086 RepID=UPI002D4663D5|nr:hypothetical protein [Brevundimonas sp.]HYC67491.1 hypothetical protein [Brevundimonas sp.]
MSGNSPGREGMDQRVARTRGRLGHALMQLGRTQDLDSIRVGDLVRTAGVGRSTFYAHFQDRDDFLGRSFCGMIDICDALARREGLAEDILPVAHVTHHVAGNLAFARSAGRSRAMEVMLAAGEQRLRLIAGTNLDAALPRVAPEERRQVAAFLAGAFVGQLRLWVQNDLRTAPQTLIAANRRLTAGVLDALKTAPPLIHDRRPVHVP